MPELLPLFLNLTGRDVLLVGGGRIAESKLGQLLAAGGRGGGVSPPPVPPPRRARASSADGGLDPADLDGAWLVVAAATPEVNRAVAEAAEPRRIFVNA